MDKLLDLIDLPVSLLIKLIEKRPVAMSIIALVMTVLSVTGIYFSDKAGREQREANRLKSLNYQTQIQQLNDTQNNIRELLAFVETKKNALRETEDAISSLQKQREELQPIVESNKAVVEALFRAQDERNTTSIWRERWVGFGFGVLASLLASFIWFVIRMTIKNRYNRSLKPPVKSGG